MDYSPKRIVSVVIGYIKRKLELRKTFKINLNYEAKIIDLTNSKVSRITDSTPESNIVSILGNNFFEMHVNNFHTVSDLLSKDNEYKMTDGGVTLGAFKYFYGIYNNKLRVGELNTLPLDMECYPVRNLKHKHGRIVESYVDEKKYIVLKDEFGNIIEMYNNTYGPVKSLFIGEKKQFLLVTKPSYDNTNTIPFLNEFLRDNPSYYVQLDNGRYCSCQIGDINKNEYMRNSFETYDELFVFGELK